MAILNTMPAPNVKTLIRLLRTNAPKSSQKRHGAWE